MTTWMASQIRIARHTNQLERMVRFYHDGLGLPEVGRFEGHAGYSGVILGMPDTNYQLELTQHEKQRPLPTPDPDNLLVFYIPNKENIGRLVVKLGAMGHLPVPPENPYWERHGVTIADPDGWRVVLMEV